MEQPNRAQQYDRDAGLMIAVADAAETVGAEMPKLAPCLPSIPSSLEPQLARLKEPWEMRTRSSPNRLAIAPSGWTPGRLPAKGLPRSRQIPRRFSLPHLCRAVDLVLIGNISGLSEVE
jgi:hypothetical protein